MMRKTILLPRCFERVLASEFERFDGRALGVCALQRRLQCDSRRSCVCYFCAFSFGPWSCRATATLGSHREYGRGPFSCCLPYLKPFHVLRDQPAGVVS
jgi:hypothetical protein